MRTKLENAPHVTEMVNVPCAMVLEKNCFWINPASFVPEENATGAKGQEIAPTVTVTGGARPNRV